MRVATYLCSIAALLTACTTTSSTPVASPAPRATSVSVGPSATLPPTASPSTARLSVDVPAASNLVAGYGSLWARSGSALWQISSKGQVVGKVPNVFSAKPNAVGPQNLAVGAGSIWTVEPRTVIRIDPSTRRATARIDAPRGCDRITAGSGAMFLGCRDSRLVRIDPETNKASVVTTVGVSPAGIAYDRGSVWWIDSSEAGGVSKIDPSSGSTADVSTPYATFVVAANGHIWFVDANGLAFTLDRSGSRATAASKKARGALGVTSDSGSVLINDGDLVVFHAGTGAVTRRTHVSGIQGFDATAGVAVLGPNIWLVDPAGQRIVAVAR